MRANIGDFVGGKFTVPSLFMGGLGDFVPGRFAIPQTPVGLSGLGWFVPGRFALPENPIALSGCAGLGCGGGCSCQQRGMGGLGDLASVQASVSQWINNLPVAAQWLLAGGIGYVIGYGIQLAHKQVRRHPSRAASNPRKRRR